MRARVLHLRRGSLLGVAALFCLMAATPRVSWGAPIVIDLVTVGDPDNAPKGNLGRVQSTYRIGKYEVTNAQYVVFLNAVDPTGGNALGLYSSGMTSDARGGIAFNSGAAEGSRYSTKANMAEKPVNYVNVWDAMRFTNWLHNGQGAGDTENGAYTITADGIANYNIVRNADASFFLPSSHEWFKAAFYDPTLNSGAGGYYNFATMSNLAPTAATASLTGSVNNPGANVVNHVSGAVWNGQTGNVTTVGSAGLLSASFYGTFDQSGNVQELTETYYGTDTVYRFGGSYSSNSTIISSNNGSPIIGGGEESPTQGFRIGAQYIVPQEAPPIPEPGTFALLAPVLLGGVVAVWRIRRRNFHLANQAASLASKGVSAARPSRSAISPPLRDRRRWSRLEFPCGAGCNTP